MHAVELQQVTKTFGPKLAVDNLDLQVPRGTIYGFIGPNGSGKTTTLRMILNILLPDSGTIRLLGGHAPGTCLDRLGYLPEERGLYRRMKLRDVLRFVAELRCGEARRREVDAWLERFGLMEYADRRVETLSKGMSQKVQFIAAVVTRPDLLILDEPFSGLDPVNTEAIRAAILELSREGVTVIFSTHDMNTAESLCGFIFMIFRGRKVLDGTLESIQAAYGADTLRVRTDLGPGALADLPGVDTCTDLGRFQALRLRPEADPQRVLRTLADRGCVHHFEVARPSLHEIFVRIANPAENAEEVADVTSGSAYPRPGA